MKNLIVGNKSLLVVAIWSILISCSKNAPASLQEPEKKFTDYIIEAGNQLCNQDIFFQTAVTRLKFTVKFDSTAIYQTQDPQNQADINKLFGFSDNKSHHQQFSARFGWRWFNNALNLQAYVYNNGQRETKDLGNIEIGKEYACEIRVKEGAYEFVVGEEIITTPRNSVGTLAEGYKLYPYFGGDEVAPHTIHIYIREDK